MEKYMYFPRLVVSFATALIAIVTLVNGQSSIICTGEMIRTFVPCIDFLTGGSNASSPTPECCDSLRNLTSNGQDCLCLIVTGGVPFQVPLNQTLAMSFLRACRLSGEPVECKATASPVPAPGPRNPREGGPNMPSLSPTPSPRGPENPGEGHPNISQRPSPPSPRGPQNPGEGQPNMSPRSSPPSPNAPFINPQPSPPEGGDMRPPPAPEGDIVPTLTPPGMRPTLNPSAAHPSHTALPSLLAIFGIIFSFFKLKI